MEHRRFKQVIVVRADLKMGRGKTAVQVAHAAVLGADKVKKIYPEWYREWEGSGQAKITVKVRSLDELMQIKKEAEKVGLPLVMVEDRGLTQLSPGTITCIGIGPASSEKLDPVTGGLKLL